VVRIASTAMELVLLGRLFGECHNLFFGMSLILRKRHPFANDFSSRFVIFHIRGSLAYLIWDSGPRERLRRQARQGPVVDLVVAEHRLIAQSSSRSALLNQRKKRTAASSSNPITAFLFLSAFLTRVRNPDLFWHR
jgi:hypothetical protein